MEVIKDELVILCREDKTCWTDDHLGTINQAFMAEFQDGSRVVKVT